MKCSKLEKLPFHTIIYLNILICSHFYVPINSVFIPVLTEFNFSNLFELKWKDEKIYCSINLSQLIKC